MIKDFAKFITLYLNASKSRQEIMRSMIQIIVLHDLEDELIEDFEVRMAIRTIIEAFRP